ncbi:MAG: 30S ribosomal protein S16 [Alphaproteobacteria bacterium]|nr:30S ribosomal protein S16 [Alphaproteobacteria bacterium]
MSVRIRLARGGSKKRPFHKIVVADSRCPRDGRYIEKLGFYNPLVAKDHPEHVKVDADRVAYWLSVGAEPTDRIARLFSVLGLCEAPVRNEQTKKPQPKAKAQERAKEKAEKAEALKQAEAEAKAETEAQAKAKAEAPKEAEVEAPKAEENVEA